MQTTRLRSSRCPENNPARLSLLRRLIINADDFGLTSGVNRAIFEAHRRGIVTSATLMANSNSFNEAIDLAVSMPRLSVGCHLVLVDGSPLLASDRVPSLIGSGAEYHATFGQFAKAALRKKLRSDEIEGEATAQIQRIQKAGLNVSHVDSHKHTHMLPLVGAAAIRAAKNCGVLAIRNPFVPNRPLAFADLARRPKLWTRYAETRLLRAYRREFIKHVAAAGMVTTDGTFGVISTGALDLDLFCAIVDAVPEGTWEFVCHPGYVDEQLGTIRTRLRESRQKELEVLTSNEARQALAERGIELISYADLVAN